MKNILAKPAVAAMRRLLRRFIGGAEDGSGGSVAVEAALILPTLVLMMIATADFGMGFYRKMQVQDAAQAGAQWAAANSKFDSTKISTAVTSATSFSGIAASPAPLQRCGCAASTGVTFNGDTAPFCTSRCSDTTVSGTYVTVSATATYTTMLPYPKIPASFSFRADTTARIQ
ncbi:MAG: TadE family protein [Methylococcales bacterium]